MKITSTTLICLKSWKKKISNAIKCLGMLTLHTWRSTCIYRPSWSNLFQKKVCKLEEIANIARLCLKEWHASYVSQKARYPICLFVTVLVTAKKLTQIITLRNAQIQIDVLLILKTRPELLNMVHQLGQEALPLTNKTHSSLAMVVTVLLERNRTIGLFPTLNPRICQLSVVKVVIWIKVILPIV